MEMQADGTQPTPRRFRGARVRAVGDVEVPVADGPLLRLLGLALLDCADAGPGLLLPRCRSVHTFGMRFALDVVFLDGDWAEIRRVETVGPRRLLNDHRAAAVLELPARAAG